MALSTSVFEGNKKEKWLENFARFGFIAKGIVYCLIGILTVLTAFGMSNKKADKAGAFNVIYEQPLGQFLLAVIGLGLLGYVTWRLFQAFRDTENKGSNAKGILTRIGYAVSSIVYGALCVYAFKLAFSGPKNSDNGSREFLVSKVLALDAGAWIIGIAALIIVGKGVWQIYQAVSGKFMKKVQLVNSTHHGSFKKAGIVGYISRGIVLGLVGYFLLRAALTHSAQQAKGTDAAFDFLQNNFGTVLMALVAAGLVGYGIFMFVKAKYERINLH